MTVSELIDKLKEMPQAARVVTLGYEGGYDDVFMIARIQIAVEADHESDGGRSIYGAHTRATDIEGTGYPTEEAVLIGNPEHDRRGP